MKTANYWITKLALESHPEGGYFKEIYRASESVSHDHLPDRFSGSRAFSTSIYYLLQDENFSAFHKINQDEIWHHYDGNVIHIHIISPDGKHRVEHLGKNPDKAQLPQVVVEAGSYFAAAIENQSGYVLAGCTVAPGFDFEDFVMPCRDDLLQQFPQHKEIITRFTR